MTETTSTKTAGNELVGRLINGRYRVERLIAAGGMGRVYQATQEPLGRAVALKVVSYGRGLEKAKPANGEEGSSSSEDRLFKQRFLREASTLARLAHPSIVTVYDFGSVEDESEMYFMAMELVSGQTLGQRLAQRNPLGNRKTVTIAKAIASALAVAHKEEIIHRDLKPANIILPETESGDITIKIVDFGISKSLRKTNGVEDTEATQEGIFLGSPRYIAPEQIVGAADARSDIYSLGIILYQCLTGKVPFEAGSSQQILLAHVQNAPMPLLVRNPDIDVPPWLEELVMSCMAKKPKDRPQSMEEVLRLLDESSTLDGTVPLPREPERRSVTRISVSDAPTPSAVAIPLVVDPTHTTRVESVVASGSPSSMKLAAIAAMVVLATLLTAAFVIRPRSAPTVAASPGAAVQAPAESVSLPESFIVTIKSHPSGAEVTEGGRVVGTTPLTEKVDNAAVKRAPKAYIVKAPGHEPSIFTVGPSEKNVEGDVGLVAISPSPSTTVVPSGDPHRGWHPAPGRPAPPAPLPSPSPALPPQPGGEIRLHR